MRAAFAFAIALSLALSALFVVGSGFTAEVGIDENRASSIGEELEGRTNSSDTSFNSSARSENEGSVAGFIISGVGDVISIIWLVVALPSTLRELGFPGWFATPIGFGFYAVVSIGIAQMAAGRYFR